MALILSAPVLVWAQAEGEIDEVTVDLEMPFPDNPEQIGSIMQVIEENALDIRQSADRLIAFTEQPAEYSWLTHHWRLNRIEDSLGDVNGALARLDEGTTLLLEGQKEALELIRPAADELSGNVGALRDYMDANPDWDMDYLELAEAIRNPADTIVQAAGLAESLSEVRTYLDELEARE